MLWGSICWVLGCICAHFPQRGNCPHIWTSCVRVAAFSWRWNRQTVLYESAHTRCLLDLVAKVSVTWGWRDDWVVRVLAAAPPEDLSLIPSIHMVAQSFDSSSSASDAICWPLLSLSTHIAQTHAGKTLTHIKTNRKKEVLHSLYSDWSTRLMNRWSNGRLRRIIYLKP